MAANWQKILFESSSIEVALLSASNIPTTSSTLPALSVLTIDEDTGRVRFISQSELQVPNGDTTFTIGSTGSNGAVDSIEFQSSGSSLTITTNDPDYLAVNVTAGTNTTTASFDPATGFITGSGQLDALNYTVSLFGTVSPSGAPSDFRTAFHTPIVGFDPFLGGPNVGSVLYNTQQIGALTSFNSSDDKILSKVTFDSFYTGSNFNLWRTPRSTVNPGTLNSVENILDPNAALNAGINGNAGNFNYFWLSASLVGGFTEGGIPSLSASLSTFTGSLDINSASIAGLESGSQAIIDTTSSMALNSPTASFLTSVAAKSVESIFHGGPIKQVTILDDSNSGVDNQGRKIQLGAIAPAESPLIGFPNSRHLTVSGTITANIMPIFGDGIILQQVNVASFAGGITYGTSSLHTHEFIGNTFITSSGIDITGPVSIGNSLPNGDAADSTLTLTDPISILAKNGDTLKFAVISNTSTLGNDIRNTANKVSSSILDRIADVQANIDLAPGQATQIDTLQSGFNILTGSYSESIGIGQTLTTTASFSASIAIGPNTDHTSISDILLASHSVINGVTTIDYRLNTSSFTTATNIITSSLGIQNAVDGLNRYGKLASLILTQSNTLSNKLYIADLADDLPNSPAGTHFLTGSQNFDSLISVGSNARPVLFNSASSLSQGVLRLKGLRDSFDFNQDTPSGGGNTDANFKDLTNNSSPKFTNLTATGDVEVRGTLVKVNKSNLNIKDQFTLINSGALSEDSVSTSNDPDGGIIVGNGNNSGSLFMYDSSHQRWGFIGANHTNVQALDVQSDDLVTLNPEVNVRVTAYRSELFNNDGTPKDISVFEYGNSDENSQLGIMAINNIDPDGNADGNEVFIYA